MRSKDSRRRRHRLVIAERSGIDPVVTATNAGYFEHQTPHPTIQRATRNGMPAGRQIKATAGDLIERPAQTLGT